MLKLISIIFVAVVYSAAAFAQVPLDVFMIGGQSNASGQGVAVQASPVIAGTVLTYDNNGSGALANAAEPIRAAGDTATGSAWSSFGATYYGETGRKVLLIPGALGGTSQSAMADSGQGNWDSSGTLAGALITRTKAAIVAARAAGYNPTVRGLLWLQGERDAVVLVLSPGTYDPITYRTAFAGMLTRFRAEFPGMQAFIFRLGPATAAWSVYEPGHAAIRYQQEFLASADSMAPIVFRGATGFAARGMMNADGVHIGQAGLNEMGAVAAGRIAIPEPQALNY